MSKVAVVAGREFLSTVRRKSYLVVTFGMPFFAVLYFGLFALLPALFMEKSAAGRRDVGLVDLAGVVRLEEAGRASAEDEELRRQAEAVTGRLAPGDPRAGAARGILEAVLLPVRFRPFATRDEAIAALRGGAIDRFYLVPADYLATGRVESYLPDEATLGMAEKRAERSLERLLARSLLSGRLPEEVRSRVETPVDSRRSAAFVVGASGRPEPLDTAVRLARVGIPFAFGFLLFMSLMVSAGYLIQGVAEEKENRVIEVILSSVRPRELLFGKLLGLGAAGLLQLAVWVSVATFATSFVAAAALAALDLRLFLTCLAFFALGFLLIGSLMTGTGALGTNSRESQQLAAIWSIAAILPPSAAAVSILDEPNGIVARVLGWFPLTAPITMMIRCGTGKVPLWDLLLAIALLAGAVYLALRAAAALFRLGLLQYGKRPPLREILRQIGKA